MVTFCVTNYKKGFGECFEDVWKPYLMELLNGAGDIDGKRPEELVDWTRVYLDKRKLWRAFRGLSRKYADDLEVLAFLGFVVWCLKDLDWVDVD